MEEQWKPVNGFEDYAVSNLGNVKRVNAGQGSAGGPIKPTPNADGYHTVSLRKNGKTFNKYVHELVAMHYLKGFDPRTRSINHKDRNRGRNRVDNLEIIDAADNKGHGRISDQKVAQVFFLAKKGKKPAEIARLLGVRLGVVQLLLKNGV